MLLAPRASAQSGSSTFKALRLAQIAEDAGILQDMNEQTKGDFLFVPPLFRYQLSVETDGKMESLTEDDTDTLKKWGTFVARPDFVARFEQKVQVRDEKTLQWVFWQSALVQPFREEQSQGGRLTINTLLIGARHRQPLLLAIGFQSA